MKKRYYILPAVFAAFFIFSGCGSSSYLQDQEAEDTVFSSEDSSDASEEPDDASEESEDENTGEKNGDEGSEGTTVCFVQVEGAVCAPGVYQLPSGSRVFSAIEAAGGLSEDACGSSVNQAQEVSDGQMIYVMTREEAESNSVSVAGQTAAAGSNAGAAGVSGGLVNINTAGADELMTLPGIGESKAQAILAYRTEHGSFQKPEDLKNISGIKDGVYAKIASYITV